MTKIKIAGIVAAAVLSFSAVAMAFGHHSESTPFDTELWKHEENSNERLRMVSDLNPKLMGMTKKQVERMLGEPRKDVPGLYRGYDYAYLLGTTKVLWDEDGIWLCIKFVNDRVNDVKVVQD